jgi:ferredoxin
MPNDKHAKGTCGGLGICLTCSMHLNKHILRPRQETLAERQLSWTSRLDDLPVFRNRDKAA